jgi:hypothetical protein
VRRDGVVWRRSTKDARSCSRRHQASKGKEAEGRRAGKKGGREGGRHRHDAHELVVLLNVADLGVEPLVPSAAVDENVTRDVLDIVFPRSGGKAEKTGV